ncbi:MAG: GNAT family N-acetyltransferase [Ruminococcus sp.]|nr:GNAT family N-acetyltransferase [Ruminococcus sp.]
MARHVKRIETNRLVLRGINENDTEKIVEWRSDPKVYMYFKAPHRISIKEHLNWFHSVYLENDNRFDWICIEKDSGKRIGVFGLYREEMTAEVNYILAPEARHKGYATESIKCLVDFASKNWNCKYIIAEIHQDNKSSIALVEKLGYKIISCNGSFIVYRIEV